MLGGEHVTGILSRLCLRLRLVAHFFSSDMSYLFHSIFSLPSYLTCLVPRQNEHFSAANLDRRLDQWFKVYDFSEDDQKLGPAPHYKIVKLVPSTWSVDGTPTVPCSPMPKPSSRERFPSISSI